MSRKFALSCLTVAAAMMLAGGRARADEPAAKKAKPKVEVVFCLDTTGSMGGLIEAAKQKIWAISNQIASGQPTPQLKIGLVAFRDRGDTYVTKVTDLTDDLDAVHAQVMSFQAQGGGDEPESVNKALHDAVTCIKWSKDKSTLKLIFLVGDAPPHMDYDEVKYPEICKLAVKKNIIINSVQCGSSLETQKYWKDICQKAEGSYVQIDANGGPVVVIKTPFDTALADINAQMAKSTLVYGGATEQLKAREKAMSWAVPSGAFPYGPGPAYPAPLAYPPPPGYEGYPVPTASAAPAPGSGLTSPSSRIMFAPVYVSSSVAADRACFNAATGCVASYDLLDSIKAGKVKLENLKKDELPRELQGLSLTQQKDYLEKLAKSRAEIMKKAADLSKQRNEFIAKKQAEDASNRGRDSFDNQVLRILQRQAGRNRIDYPDAEKEKK